MDPQTTETIPQHNEDTVVIYHGGCSDGVAAAWCAWSSGLKATWYPGVYGKEPPWELIRGKWLYLLDFSYKRDVMERIIEECPYVCVLDHHESAERELQPLLEANKLGGLFDMEKSGCMLAWYHFRENPVTPHFMTGSTAKPSLLFYIDAHDRWTDKRNPHITRYYKCIPHHPEGGTLGLGWEGLMDQWDRLMSLDVSKMYEMGGSMNMYHETLVRDTKPHAVDCHIAGYVVPIVNAPPFLASDVAGELAQESESGVGAVWWCNQDHSCSVSLRSRGEVNVSRIAELFGGGGHAGAAGFKVPDLVDVNDLLVTGPRSPNPEEDDRASTPD